MTKIFQMSEEKPFCPIFFGTLIVIDLEKYGLYWKKLITEEQAYT